MCKLCLLARQDKNLELKCNEITFAIDLSCLPMCKISDKNNALGPSTKSRLPNGYFKLRRNLFLTLGDD